MAAMQRALLLETGGAIGCFDDGTALLLSPEATGIVGVEPPRIDAPLGMVVHTTRFTPSKWRTKAAGERGGRSRARRPYRDADVARAPRSARVPERVLDAALPDEATALEVGPERAASRSLSRRAQRA